MKPRLPWIHNATADVLWIISPAFWPLLPLVCFPEWVQAQQTLSPFWWLFFVVIIDAAHVYATMYRTYFSASYQERKMLYTFLPLAGWAGGVVLYSIDSMLFWHILAYAAVFHFLRQQYGFMRIYSRQQQQNNQERQLDSIAIYTAMLYPLLYWHTHTREFSWFVDGDILVFPTEGFALLGWLHAAILLLWVYKEGRLSIKQGYINWPKTGIMTGTAVSWYFGIVYFNADWIFTAFNVLSHGIPYMALVWFYARKESLREGPSFNKWLMGLSGRRMAIGLALFIGLPAFFAWVEEGIWDAMVWGEHTYLFPLTAYLPVVEEAEWLSLLIPLLALPQITHYLLDAFIWKIRRGDTKWVAQTMSN
jgi:hypothetical protein